MNTTIRTLLDGLSRRVRAAVSALLALAAFALALPVAAQAAGPASGTAAAAAQSAAPTEYRLGPGDAVRISVYQNPDLTVENRIGEAGTMSFPLLGSVRLGGMTVAEAERSIADALRRGNFVRQPQVTVLVTQVRGNQISVLGQVNRPGRFPIEVATMQLSDALAMAGGITNVGSETIVIVGSRDGRPFRREVELPSIFRPDGRNGDIGLTNGDVIWVERAPMAYIYGEVQRPGPMRIERNMTLLQALATGGGLTQRGTERGIRIHRRGTDGKVQVVQPQMDEPMRDGDVIYVRESIF